MNKINMIVILIAISVLVPTTLGAEMLDFRGSCTGCTRVVNDNIDFYADIGNEIIISVSASGGYGNKNYEVKNELGDVVCTKSSCRIKVEEGIESFKITVSDDSGFVEKSIKIHSISKNICLPRIVSISVEKEEKKAVVGETIQLSARLSGCDKEDYEIYWVSSSEEIQINNPSSLKTTITIMKKDRSSQNPSIFLLVTSGDQKRKSDEIDFQIFEKRPLKDIEIVLSDPIYSYTDFTVYCNSDEDVNFIRKCSATLFDYEGNIVDRDSSSTREKKNLQLTLTPGSANVHKLKVDVIDNANEVYHPFNDNISVKMGKTYKDIPSTKDIPKEIHCFRGEDCVINIQNNISFAQGDILVSYFVNEEELRNKDGRICVSVQCTLNLTSVGDFDISFFEKYADPKFEESSSAIIKVIVEENTTEAEKMQSSASSQIEKKEPRSYQSSKKQSLTEGDDYEEVADELERLGIPGFEFLGAFLAIIIAGIGRKRSRAE